MKTMREMINLCERFQARSLSKEFRETLPATYVIPKLQNNDSYTQYRYGIAVAAAAAMAGGENDFEQISAFGENLTIIGYSKEEQRIIELAAKLMGVQPVLISTPCSEEPSDTFKNSPVAKWR